MMAADIVAALIGNPFRASTACEGVTILCAWVASTSEADPCNAATTARCPAFKVRFRGRLTMTGRIDFGRLSSAALAILPSLLARWLRGGYVQGPEYISRNPKRHDRRPGSFKINLATGRWADFAIDSSRGGDVVSLAAYLAGIGQVEAAERLAGMLVIEARERKSQELLRLRHQRLIKRGVRPAADLPKD